MSILHYCTAMALLTGALAATAQQPAPHPADTNTPVPPMVYQSAFRNYQPSMVPQETPDKRWRAANDEMGQLGGHAGHLKEASTAKSTPASEPDSSVPAQQHTHH